jgi:hypothetical protein
MDASVVRARAASVKAAVSAVKEASAAADAHAVEIGHKAVISNR